ncbi:MAG: hypothetical protein WD066_18150 [Planctomycetaceae bacterium]
MTDRDRNADGESVRPNFASSRPLCAALPALAIGTGLTFAFWLPLWCGGGFTGGDVYFHTFPEKLFLVDWWRQGVFPVWNDRFGNGFPLVAEGMTAPFYPTSLLFYGLLDANSAFNANHQLHYALCFAFTWMFARKMGLSRGAAALAGLVYTYGWFPARRSWEVAIIAGAYLPLFLWLVENYLETRRARWLGWLGLAIGVQILAGQYNQAFISHVVVGLYVFVRIATAAPRSSGSGAPDTDVREPPRHRWSPLATVAAAGLLGYAIAAVTVLPTWELKQRSPRGVDGRFDPLQGVIPVAYLPQAALPWKYYTIDEEEYVRRFRSGSRMESHLYFGLIPLALVAWGTSSSSRRRAMPPGLWTVWCVVGGFTLAYAVGWLPFVAHLPGFDFFRGPARYGYGTTFAVAMLAAAMLDSLLLARRVVARWSIVACVLLATTADLWWVGRQVGESELTWRPAIDFRDDSELARVLAEENERGPVRVLTALTAIPAENVPSLYRVATYPPRLALPPLAYADVGSFQQRAGLVRPMEGIMRDELERLHRVGVTHVLSPQRLDEEAWRAELVWRGRDELLVREWQSGFSGPLHLYRLRNAPGRAWFADATSEGTARVVSSAPHEAAIEANSPRGGTLVLTDLAWPGWSVSVDGEPAEAIVVDELFRGVDLPPGKHVVTWWFQPTSLYWGAAISVVAIALASTLVWRGGAKPQA